MLLGPVCNHDLNCFLRLPQRAADSDSREVVINAMLDAMGDNEYYCASYASKEEPHVEGLLHTLQYGLRHKEAEIRALQDDCQGHGDRPARNGTPQGRTCSGCDRSRK